MRLRFLGHLKISVIDLGVELDRLHLHHTLLMPADHRAHGAWHEDALVRRLVVAHHGIDVHRHPVLIDGPRPLELETGSSVDVDEHRPAIWTGQLQLPRLRVADGTRAYELER